MAIPQLPLVGEQLGPYRLDQELTRSGMDVVFKGFDTTLNREAALKVLAPELAAIPTAAIRFKNVARNLASLSHPNCLRIDAAGEQNGICYLVMELAEGASVADLIQQYSPFDPRQTAKLLRQAALGLQHAAQHEILHHRLLPTSLIVTNDGVLKILDFGLAHQLAMEVEPDLFIKFFGTPQYLSPETAAGQRGDLRSDIYSLGAIGYHLLTGLPPVTGDTVAAVVEQHKTQAPAPIIELCPTVPQELAHLVERMLANHPTDRPKLYQDLIAKLDQFLHPAQVQPVPAPSGPAVPVPGRPYQRPAAPPQQPHLGDLAPKPAPAAPQYAPGERLLQHRPLPKSAPATRQSSLGMGIGLLITLGLVLAGVWFYFKTAPEWIRKGSFWTTVVTPNEEPAQPAPPVKPPPAPLSPQAQAEADFKMVKLMADSLVAKSDWVEAWNLYDQFRRSPRYRGTTVPATAEIERQRIQELVEKSWAETQKEIKQLNADSKFDEALLLCDKYTAVGREIAAIGTARYDELLRTLVAKLSAASDTSAEWKNIASAVNDGNWDIAAQRLQALLDRTDDAFVKAHTLDLQKLYDVFIAKPSTRKDTEKSSQPEKPAEPATPPPPVKEP